MLFSIRGARQTVDLGTMMGASGFRNSAFVVTLQVHVYAFGSVPLKTYLPDGDIDLSIFLKNATPETRVNWLNELEAALKAEQRRTGASRIGDVSSVSRAEVRPATACTSWSVESIWGDVPLVKLA